MALIVPDSLEVELLNIIVTQNLTMRLYSNNVTPSGTSTTAQFTETSGGGYVNKPLVFANWTIASGAPSSAIYDITQEWIFTGPVSGLNQIYGYYVTRDSDNDLMWAERFPPGIVPFQPIAGSKIGVVPRFTIQSLF